MKLNITREVITRMMISEGIHRFEEPVMSRISLIMKFRFYKVILML